MKIDRFGYKLFTFRVAEGEEEQDDDLGEDDMIPKAQMQKIVGKRLANAKAQLAEATKQSETMRAEKEALLGKLEKIQATNTMSEADKEILTGEIDELKTSLQTKEEQQKSEITRVKAEYTGKLTAAEEDAKRYQRLFQTQAINTALLAAANKEGALNAQQIQAMYAHSVELVQDRDAEGNQLESYTPMLSFTGIGKNKKQETMQLPVGEALAKIREDGMQSNLFKGHQVGGSGASPVKRGSDGKPVLTKDNPPKRSDYSSSAEWASAAREYSKQFLGK